MTSFEDIVTSSGWKQIPMIKGLPLTHGTTSWRKGNLKVLFSPKELHTEKDLGGGYWKHLSISHPKRYPFWQEILDARYTFFSKDETVVQIMPPKNEYVNLHPNCFHLWSKLSQSKPNCNGIYERLPEVNYLSEYVEV